MAASTQQSLSTAPASAVPRVQAPAVDLPPITITLAKLHHTVTTADISGQAGSRRSFCNRGRSALHVLHPYSGTFAAGRATLVISSPGGGASTLLRVLAGRQIPSSGAHSILYSGCSLPQLQAEKGASIRKLAAYCGEDDVHESLLTVSETFKFTHASSNTGSSSMTDAITNTTALRTATGGKYSPPDHISMLTIMGLKEAASTKIGNALIRGISGGQKRRVSVGEALLTRARVVCLDQPTSGLDSATALSIMQYACNWARETSGILVAAVHQTGPEILACFDDVMMLSEGHVLYHGPVTSLEGYLSGMGLVRPGYHDLADWASEIMADPTHAAQESMQERTRLQSLADTLVSQQGVDPEAAQSALAAAKAVGAHPVPPGFEGSGTASANRLTHSSMANAWQAAASIASKDAESAVAGTSSFSLCTPYARSQYGTASSSRLWTQLSLVFTRQFELAWRNWLYVALRLVNCSFMGVILGSVYYKIDDDNFILKYSAALFVLCFVAFINNAEIPLSMNSRAVVYKQTNSGLYSEYTYILAVLAAHLPLTIVSDFIYATILYWMIGFVSDAGRWLYFYLVIISLDLCTSVMYRSFSFWSPSGELAMTAGTAFIAVGLATGGFFVTRFQLPTWLSSWLLYLSPFFWGVTSISNNEFRDDKYSAPLMPNAPAGSPSRGESYLSAFDFPFGSDWQHGGIAFLLGVYLVVGLTIQPFVLWYVRHDLMPGTQRLPADEYAVVADAAAQAAGNAFVVVNPSNVLPTHASSSTPTPAPTTTSPRAQAVRSPAGDDSAPAAAASALHHHPQKLQQHLPFTKVTLAFDNIRYSVQVAAAKGKSSDGSDPASAPPTSEISGAESRTSRRGGSTDKPGSPSTSKGAYGDMDAPFPGDNAAGGGIGSSSSKRYTNKALLRGVSGFALPGTLTALMGASGAGKTTLMDVLAFRKTTGAVRGRISINGVPASQGMVKRVSGYVEQEDVHLGEYTIRESILFSAKLRLDPSLSTQQRDAFVSEILEMLELTLIADRRVSTLARGELKRLTIGVELAGNPPLLFLDEPTSGLDARSATMVVSVLRRIAATGRTVVCTIHQPSAAVFFGFSHLLLLAPGGWQVYFGGLGERAEWLQGYLEGIPGVAPLPPGCNPSTWMMATLEKHIGDAPVATTSVMSVRNALEDSGITTTATRISSTDKDEEAATGTVVPAASADVTAMALGGDAGHLHAVQRRQEEAKMRAAALGLPATLTIASHFASFYKMTRLYAVVTEGLSTLMSSSGADTEHGAPSKTSAIATLLSSKCDRGLLSLPLAATEQGTSAANSAAAALVLRAVPSAISASQPVGNADDLVIGATWISRFLTVVVRQWTAYARDPAVYVVRPVMMIALAVFFGICYLDLDRASFSGAFSSLGAILASSGFVGVLLYTTVVPMGYRYRAVFYRERAAGMYSPEAFSLALLLTELPWVALSVAIFSPIFYYLVGFKPAFVHMLWYAFLTWLTAVCYTYGGWAAAFMLPSPIIAQVVGGFFLAITFLFGCVFVPPAYVPRGWGWFIELDYAAWGTRGVAADQFDCTGVSGGCPTINVITAQGPAQIDAGEFLLGHLLQFPAGNQYLSVLWMFTNAVGFAAAVVMLVRFVSHQKR